MITTLLIAIILASLAAAYLYLKKRFNYWKHRGVPTLNRPDWILGDLAPTIFGKENFCTTIQNAYTEFRKRGCKFGGLYFLNNPMFLVTDPEMAKLVMVKDFDHFMDRGIRHDVTKYALSGNMFSLDGDEWKFIRHKLSPAFTGGKLRNMMRIMEEHIDIMCGVLQKKCEEDLLLFSLLERLGIDIIGHTAFGLNCNALEGESSKFHEMTSSLFNPKLWEVIKVTVRDGFKNPANLVQLLTNNLKVEAFFIELVSDTVKYREANRIKSNDFLQMLIDLMNPEDGQKGLTVKEVTSQAYLFFLAAYETQSKTLNLCFYELGRNKELQDRLRRQIREDLEKSGGKYEFDMVMDNKLLDRIIKETTRKHPSVLFVNRICTKKYVIPDTSIVIEEGTPTILPIYAFQHDPDNFADPEVFDPERFSAENEGNIKPYTYFPFGEGPRYCIGKRMALLQVKLVIMKLVRNFEFTVSSKTEEPLMLDPVTRNLLLSYKGAIWINVKKAL